MKDYCSFLVESAGGAVLAWMVEGARRFIANGCTLTPPQCVRDEVEAYRAENDWLSQFIAEQCEVGKDFTVKASDLQLAYRTYCDESGEYCRRSNDFKTALEAAGFERHKTKAGMIYTGLRLGVEVL